MLVIAATTAANAWMMQPVMDRIFVEKNHQLLLIIPVAVFVIAVVKGLAAFEQAVTMKYISQRITTDMQLDLYRHLINSDIAMFNDQSSGKLISRFSNDIGIIRRNLSNVMVGLARDSVTVIFLVAVMFYQSLTLSLITFLVFPLAILPVLKLGRKMRKLSDRTQDEMGNYTARLDDTFQGVRMVKAYGNEEYEIGKAREFMESIFKLYTKAARNESASSPIMESLAGIAIALVIWYGGNQVLNNITTPGAFFSFIAALIMAYKPAKSLSSMNNNLQEALAAVKRVFDVLDTEPKIKDSPNAKELNFTRADIELRDVNFSYNKEKSALSGVNIKAESGKRIALVGASGAGKSTIMNLILRFYDPDSGAVIIGGEDIKNVTTVSLRNKIAVVSQEATLFDDTIRANIKYGRMDASEDEILAAAKSASAHEFISEQPQGYDTEIGQQGLRLSGGQRQRIAIARAMLRNAPILLLDEATSALDTVSEQQVQQALERLMSGRTTVIIAHRLSTIINSDLIYVMEGGKVVEHGTHDELLAQKGAYTKLYERQFKTA